MYNDVTGVVLRENTLLRIVSLGLGAVVALLVLTIVVLGSRQPYVGALVLDKASGASKVVTLPSVDSPDLHQQFVQYFVPLVIESLFTVSDTDADKRNLIEFVRPYLEVPSQAATTIDDYFKDNDPVARGKTMRVQILVDPISGPKITNEYLVGWTAITRDLHGRIRDQRHYVGDIVVAWRSPSTDNLTGLKIVGLTIDQPPIPAPQGGG